MPRAKNPKFENSDINLSTMPVARPGFPFRIFLPLTQLLLCLALLWPHLPALRNQLSLAIREFSAKVFGTEPPAEPATIVLDVTPISPRHEQPLDISAVRLTAAAALNIPVGFIQIPFMVASSSRSEWTPSGMWVREWRAVSWPFVGMVFWWIAGRGLEALSAGLRFFLKYRRMSVPFWAVIHPPLHWIEMVVGASLLVMGSASCYALESGPGLLGLPTDHVLAAGGALWAVLGLIVVSASMVQWRVRKIERRERMAVSAVV